MRFGFFLLANLISSAVLAQAPQCTRGEPEPTFHSDNVAVQSVSFKPVSSHEATEEVIFKSGDRLTIRNWGCDAFTLTFRFESKTLSAADPYSQAVQVLRRLAAMKADAVFDLSRAADGLDALIKRRTAFTQGELYGIDGDDGDGGDFQHKFALRAAGLLPANGGRYLEFDLTLGPL